MVNHAPERGSAGAVRDGFEIDVPRLTRWLAANIAGFAGPLAIDQFEGGQSNPTYRLRTPSRNYVLRRQPPGALQRSAHAVEREYRVIAALGGEQFPVPRVFGLCEDPNVIGSSFYVMECVEGRGFWNVSMPDLAPEQRARVMDSMNLTIAQLHRVDFEAIGLGDYGRDGNYVERQVSRFSRQYQEEKNVPRVPALDRLIEWLPANLPAAQARSIVHGDFKMDNMLFAPDLNVAAVLDWELSTLGDPLADFAYNVMMYRMPQGLGPSLVGLDLAAMGIPEEAEYVAAYCRRTGRQCIPDIDFYIAFNMFRLAAILHGVLGRVVRGNAASSRAADVAARMEPLAEAGWAQAMQSPR